MRRSRILVIAAAVCTVAACVPIQAVTSGGDHTDDFGTPVGDQRVRSGGELVMGLSNEPDRLDPTTSTSLYTRYVMNAICEKLYDLDAGGRIVPQLATALPTTSADGRTVTIPVRTGVRFADGSPFDATAVQTSLRRHLTHKTSQRASEMGPVESITATGPDSVSIRYKRPFAPITAALADRAGMIMSPAALEARGDGFSEAPVCVGPFKFVQRVPQTSITVARDPNYYDAAHVRLDTIVYRIMPDANTRAANLRSADIQVADTISPQDVDALAKDKSLRVLQAGSLGYQGVTVNVGNVDGVGKPPKPIDKPLARDPRVREAFTLTVDRQTLVNTVFNNWYEPACSPVPPQSPYATAASNACPKFDPARSRQLLAEAGVPVPLRVDLHVSNTQDELRYAQALQASVAEGGFDLRIVPVEYSTLLDLQKRGDYELLQLGWSGRIDPDSNMTRFLAAKAAGNVGGYFDTGMEALLSRAAQTNDVRQRAELYGTAVQMIQRDNPIVYTYRKRNLTAHTKAVTGIETYADGVVRLGRAAFVEGQEG